MKLMVIGGFGRVGRLVVKDAQKARMDVTVVSLHRHDDVDLGSAKVLIKSITDLTAEDVSGYDAILDATAGWTAEAIPNIYGGLAHVLQLLDQANPDRQPQVLKVGGTNTLYINSEHTQTLQHYPNYYADKYADMCDAHQKALDIMRTYTKLAWTYLTPSYNFDKQGAYTGEYHIEGEEFTPVDGGDNGVDDYISYADYAKATVDIIKDRQYLRQQITLVHGDKPQNK